MAEIFQKKGLHHRKKACITGICKICLLIINDLSCNYGFESSFMAPDYLIFTPKTRKDSSEMAANGGQFCIFWPL